MTNEEALIKAKKKLVECEKALVECNPKRRKHYEDECYFYLFIVDALEKQIPAKPFPKAESMLFCPKCDNTVSRRFVKGYEHCCRCGQALDWSED